MHIGDVLVLKNFTKISVILILISSSTSWPIGIHRSSALRSPIIDVLSPFICLNIIGFLYDRYISLFILRVLRFSFLNILGKFISIPSSFF
jgi:hypothetical protein